MSDMPDLSKAAGDFELSKEKQLEHEQAIAEYEAKKKAKLASKGLDAPVPIKSKLTITFVMPNIIHAKPGEEIPEDIQKKADDAIVAYLRRHFTERNRFNKIVFNDGAAIVPMFGGALRSISMIGLLPNEFPTEGYFDMEEYKAWKKNPNNEPVEENEDDEDDYDDDDDEEEEEEEDEEDNSDKTYDQILAAALEKFSNYEKTVFVEAVEADTAADAANPRGYNCFKHIPKLSSFTLVNMGTV